MNSHVLSYPPSLHFAPGLVSGLSREKHSQINAKEAQERQPLPENNKKGVSDRTPLLAQV